VSPEVLAAGFFGIAGAVVGALLGLFSERWVRTWGKVLCEIEWKVVQGGGNVVRRNVVGERQLKATFLNRKDVPVTVWAMWVVFYKGGEPLDEEERPSMQFVDASAPGGRSPMDLVNLPPRIPVMRTIFVAPGTTESGILRGVKSESLRAVEEADRAEFVAIIEGAKDIRIQLAPWNDSTTQTAKSS
jgi:hypothetical protein